MLDDIKVIAKFRLKFSGANWEGRARYEFFPVNGSSGLDEDKRFNKYTPAGHIQFDEAHPDVFPTIRAGEEHYFYVLFMPATSTVPEGDNVVLGTRFEVQAMERMGDHGEGGRKVKLVPAYDHENRVRIRDEGSKKLWSGCTSGWIEMQIDNPPAAAQFAIDQRWMVVFVKAEADEARGLQFYTLPPATAG